MSRHPLPFDFPAPDGDLFIKLLSGKKKRAHLKNALANAYHSVQKNTNQDVPDMDTTDRALFCGRHVEVVVQARTSIFSCKIYGLFIFVSVSSI